MYLFRAWGSDGGSGHMKYICRSCGICEHEFLRGIRMGAVILENSKFVWPKFLGEEGLTDQATRGPELTHPRLGMWNFRSPCYEIKHQCWGESRNKPALSKGQASGNCEMGRTFNDL